MVACQPHAPVSRPQVPQEYADTRKRLIEYSRRHPLLVRTEAEGPELLQPNSDGIPHAVSEVSRRRQIHLNPGSLAMYPGSNGIAEDLFREVDDLLGEGRIIGRVLDCV